MKWSKITWWGIAVIMLWVFFNIGRWKHAGERGKIIDWDIISYYGYLPAAVIHKDLSLKFIDEAPDGYAKRREFWWSETPVGGRVFKFTMGNAIMYAPFFLLADAYVQLAGGKRTGFTGPYEFFLALSSLFYLMLGLWFLRKVLLRHFSEGVVSVVLLAVLFGTNLFYYTTWEPAMSHGYSFALISIYLYVTIRWLETQKLKYAVFWGLLFGLITLIRPINMLVVLFLLFYGVWSVKDVVTRVSLLLTNFPSILLAGVSAFLMVLPQLLYWKMNTGQWIYYSYGDEHFYFNNPHILEGLFSFRKGWFIYTPLMLLALFGLIPMYKTKAPAFIPVVAFMAVYIYVVFSWWCWWYGGSFGMRSMIDTYPFMAFPLAAVFAASAGKKVLRITLPVLVLFFIALNLVQTKQYRKTIIHWDSMTREAYFKGFMKLQNPPGLENLFCLPDYEKAMKGEDEYTFDWFTPSNCKENKPAG